MFWLSSDHTGGPATRVPQVADNDLAVGKIVDEISHSKYWKDSAIFVVEDDSQAGLDHVDGHRAPIQIISPWAQHGSVDPTYYSQITMVRTIEQILGIQPMNQKDSAATPMFEAFRSKADLTPFNAVPNRISLTENVNPAPACGPDTTASKVEAPKVPASCSSARQGMGHMGAEAALHRPPGTGRLRQPRADEPVHLVPGPQLDQAVSR